MGDLALDGNRHAFEVEGLGKFVVRRPTIGDQITIGVNVAKRLGGIKQDDLDDATRATLTLVEMLKTVIIQAPEGFDLEKLHTDEHLLAVYEEFARWRDSFFRGTGKESVKVKS